MRKLEIPSLWDSLLKGDDGSMVQKRKFVASW